MKIAVVTTGDEILQGIIIDTNSAWISERCHMFGHEIVYHASVGDSEKDIINALKHAETIADCVIVSGGLGPTVDDITVESAAKGFSVQLQFDQNAYADIERFFEKAKRPMAKTNKKQAMIPEGGKILCNKFGTAPGVQVKFGKAIFFFLPGVPSELYQIFGDSIEPWLKSQSSGYCEYKVLRCFGMPEASIDEKISDIDLCGCRLSFRVKFPEVLLKIICRSDDKEVAAASIEKVAGQIKDRLQEVVYGEGDLGMAHVLGEMLTNKGLTISLAESCTGGLVSDLITNVPGASKYFKAGIVSYSNDVKEKLLEVPKATIETKGAVSEETVLATASGIRKISNSSIGIGISGIAGPEGGSKEKPVGIVYMAYSTKDEEKAFKHFFSGDRERIKLLASMTAINMVRLYLTKNINLQE